MRDFDRLSISNFPNYTPFFSHSSLPPIRKESVFWWAGRESGLRPPRTKSGLVLFWAFDFDFRGGWLYWEYLTNFIMTYRDEHEELAQIRREPRYSYRDAKLFCDMKDTCATLSTKLGLHAKI
jgi:hypothetical protein